jgi:hypothetical protein
LNTFNESSDTASEELSVVTQKVLSVMESNKVPEGAITAYGIDKRAKRERGKSYNDLSV